MLQSSYKDNFTTISSCNELVKITVVITIWECSDDDDVDGYI